MSQLRGAGRISLSLGTETVLIMTAELVESLLKKVKQKGNCRYVTSAPLLNLMHVLLLKCGLFPVWTSVRVVGPKKAVDHQCTAVFYFYYGYYCCSLRDQNA